LELVTIIACSLKFVVSTTSVSPSQDLFGLARRDAIGGKPLDVHLHLLDGGHRRVEFRLHFL